jgi:hypothetical protein
LGLKAGICQTVYRSRKESVSQGLKPGIGGSFDVRDKSRTYPRDKGNNDRIQRNIATKEWLIRTL